MSNFAILFADIEASSALYKKVGDQLAQKKIEECLEAMAVLTREHQGTVVKTIGDEIMCYFHQAEHAVDCAREIQQFLYQKSLNSDCPLFVRIGMHFGDAILKDSDIFGDAVNTAARMASIANGQQIVTTQDTVNTLPDELKQHAQKFDNIKIKAFKHNTVLYLIDWSLDNNIDATMLTKSTGLSTPDNVSSMYIKWGEYRAQINSTETPFIIGRDNVQCDLALPSKFASRKHTWLEFRRGKFVLVDHSTNGTWVETQDNKQVYLRREELPLWGRGSISLGQTFDENTDNRIDFVVND